MAKSRDSGIDLSEFVGRIFDPTQRMKDLADMLTIHYYLLFDGAEELWAHTKSLYCSDSNFRFLGRKYTGPHEIFSMLSRIRRTLGGDWASERVVHMVEKLQCRPRGRGEGVAVRVSGSLLVGGHCIFCGNGLRAEGAPGFGMVPPDVSRRLVGSFQEQFVIPAGGGSGRVLILSQDLYIQNAL